MDELPKETALFLEKENDWSLENEMVDDSTKSS